MKRFFIILTPPMVFALMAVIAGHTGSPAERVSGSANTTTRSPRQRATAGANSGDVFTALARMESRILPHNPVPPVELHDEKGMENAILSDERNSGFPCGGSGALKYSMEWAEDAPEEMFAWLSKQNEKRSFYAYILFDEWANHDVEAALAAAFTLEDRKLRAQSLLSSLEVLNKSDPSRARELLLQNLSIFPPVGDRPIFSGNDGSTWELLLALPSGEARTHLQAGLLTRMDSQEQAREIWKQVSETQRREWMAAGFAPFMTYAESFEGLGDLMREKAEASGDPEESKKFIESHGEAWAVRDLTGAMDWAQAHLKGKTRAEWCGLLFGIGAKSDLDSALRIWQNLPEGHMKKNAAEAIRRGAPESRKAEVEALLLPPLESDGK